MQPPSDGPTGLRFDRYVVTSQIGLGGMGVVYVATDTRLGREIALKVVSGQFASSPEFRQRFQREAATLARLDSPHIIAIYDHGEANGLPYLATQYVRGGDVGRLLSERGPLPPAQAIVVCGQVADALVDAHRVGIVHRDIKPSNVLVRDPDAPKLHAYLCDFGIALDESSDRLTTAGGVVGTWAYLSPERSQGLPASPASDIYSLGCLLWVCLTGEAPYTGTDVSVAMAHVNAPVRQLAGSDPLSTHLNQVLARTMAKDPAERYASAAEVQRALDSAPAASAPIRARALLPAPPPAPPPGGPAFAPTLAGSARPLSPAGPPPAWTPSPNRSWGGLAAVVAAVVAVLLVVGVVVLVTRGGNGDPSATDDGTDDPTSGPTTDPTTDPTSREPTGAQQITEDLDGDGLGDAAVNFQDGPSGDPFRYTLTSDGSSFSTERRKLGVFSFPVFLDWDGDGRLDEINPVPDGTDGSLKLETEEQLPTKTFGGIDVLEKFLYVDSLVGDFTGDGAADLLVWGQTAKREVTVWVLANKGGDAGFAEPVVWLTLDDAHSYTTNLYAADFDGDGSFDLLAKLPVGTPTFDSTGAFYDGPRGTRLFPSTGLSFSTSERLVRSDLLDSASVAVGDFSGDGTPLVAISQTDGPPSAQVYRTSASGLTPVDGLDVSVPDSSGYAASLRMLASDVDGDFTDDLVLTKKTGDKTYLDIMVAISDGTRFRDLETWAKAPPKCQDETVCSYGFLTPF